MVVYRFLYRLRLKVAVFLVLFFASTFAAAEDERPLIATLQSDAPKSEKAVACKRLAIWGTPDAVPALAALLPDAELSSWARIALEAIPGPAADAALRDALETTSGVTLVGVINSIGVREDALAVDQLVERMDDSDSMVATAAIAALGRIGGEKATSTLRDALANGHEQLRSAVAEGCVLCAEKHVAAGEMELAATIFDEVRMAEVPMQRIVEATRGAILARGPDGAALLIKQLKGDDPELIEIGLMAARELTGAGVSEKLVGAIRELPADRQPLLVLAMAGRSDAEVAPAMLRAVQSGSPEVRVAALEVLTSVGDVSCIPVVLKAAVDPNEAIASVALGTLKALPSEGVDDELSARLENADGAERVVLLKLVGLRRINATPYLMTAINDEREEVRSSALHALGQVAGLEDVNILIARVLHPPRPEDGPVALAALQAACVRMPDREACAEKLATAMEEAPAGAREAILKTLAAMGGNNALAAMRDAAISDDASMQDAATRLLGAWMTADAGPVLLELAKTPESSYKVRAMRGYIRLARQFVMDDAQRAEMCRNAWDAAERDAERELVLQVVERYPSNETLQLAIEATQEASQKEAATKVAKSVAKKIDARVDVESLVELARKKPMDVEIVRASYGAGKAQIDVTECVRKRVRELPFIIMPNGGYNATLGSDPAPGTVKQLHIHYRVNGNEAEASFTEDTPVILLIDSE